MAKKRRKKRFYKDRRRKQDLARQRTEWRDRIAPLSKLSENGQVVPNWLNGSDIISWGESRIYCDQFGLWRLSRKDWKMVHIKWANLNKSDMDILARYEWLPAQQKHALTALAEAAGSF